MFTANESGADAYFDDLLLTTQSAENHYDPWGLNLVGIESQDSPDHKFQYNGKEKQEEFGLHWNDGLTCWYLYWKRPFAGPDSCRVERQATFT